MTPANARGFTLVELLMSVAIITLLGGLSLPIFQSFQTRNELDVTTQQVAEMLRRAQVYARGVNGDSDWGVKVQSGSATLFKGAVFASRDAAYDETITISPSTNVGGVGEVLFTKFSGAPNTTGNITLTGVTSDIRTISINAKGMVSY